MLQRSRSNPISVALRLNPSVLSPPINESLEPRLHAFVYPPETCERLAKDPAERSYASILGDLQREIAEGEARKKKLLEQRSAAENKLLDLKVQEVLGRYSAENVAKMRDLCFKIFNGYSEILRYEQNKYGATGSRKDLNAFVLLGRQKPSGALRSLEASEPEAGNAES